MVGYDVWKKDLIEIIAAWYNVSTSTVELDKDCKSWYEEGLSPYQTFRKYNAGEYEHKETRL